MKPNDITQGAADPLEHDAARLCREIDIIDAHIKAKYAEKAAKKKELDAVTKKLVQLRIKGMK